ncbi:hypothetical protein HPB52_005331 [Rhipicephalus sanguineus]|uniref:ABC transporter domain-containing protein n=1 Tax=Rhipicephalus sanguineus TaxID=34632 RepID=A0A9D4PQE3_RHISA|nr:hypothetical protein HPB52_005331 [Rhipicephalus sanguineus]
MPKTSPKKAPAAKSNKPEPKKAHTGPSTNAKPGTPSKPPVLMVKDFPPLTPVQAQVSCWGGAVSGPSPSPSPTETALQQQIEELRRQNRFFARKIQELEAKQVGSSEPEQGAEVEDGDDGSSVTSDLTSVSRRDADTVVGSVSATGATGRLESLERKTEQLEERMAALPDQIMSAVRASFQDMFTAALTQALPEIVAQVSDSVLKAVQPWVSTQIKNTTQCDSPQLKRKTASRQAVDEDFSGLAPGKKTLLNRLYGQANPGTLTAFMGPSGAGKTTLLNILSGHYDKGYKGEVLVNGYVREAKLFNLQSSYVMQDDCLLGYLTVRETLTMSVELRTPTCGRRKISELVEDALDLWGLQGCANTLARSLSGGERKRLMIAQELMSDVPVVFLDEPTSGLDSCSALRCVRVLRTLADNGRTVLCSLHNPSASVFSQFDRLYMLSDGMCIYSGLTERLVPFLNSMNLHCLTFSSPSDFLTEVASGGHGELTVKLSSLFIPEGCPVSSEKERDDQGMVTIYGGRLMTHKTVVFVASPLCSPLIVFSGFYVKPQHLLPVVAWLPSVSHMFYAHRAIMFALYGGGRGELDCDDSTDAGICVPVDGYYVLEVIDASDVNLFVDFGAILALDVFWKLIAFCLLKWRLWRKR